MQKDPAGEGGHRYIKETDLRLYGALRSEDKKPMCGTDRRRSAFFLLCPDRFCAIMFWDLYRFLADLAFLGG